MPTPSEVWRQCNAKSKRSGLKCRAAAMRGSSKCRHHGGSTNKITNLRRALLDDARKAAAAFGFPADESWTADEALASEIRRSEGLCRFWDSYLSQSNLDEVFVAVEREVRLGRLPETSYEQVKSAVSYELYMVYLEERKHLARISVEAIRCGLSERRLRIDQSYANALLQALIGMLAKLGIPWDERSQQATLAAVAQAEETTYIDVNRVPTAPTGVLIPLRNARR